MKYNLSGIMKRAWEIKKENGKNIFGICLQIAWVEAKNSNNESLEDKIARLAEEKLSYKYCGHYKVVTNDWKKYGKDRTYIIVRFYTNAWNLKHEIKCGFIDNTTGEYVCSDSDTNVLAA